MWHHLIALFKAWRFRLFQVRQLCFSCGFFKKRLVMSRKKQRLASDQISEFDRGRTVAYRDCGLPFREIGSRVGRNQTTVMQVCDRWLQESTTDRRGRLHPPQCTTSREDRQIARMAVTDRSVTSRTTAQYIKSITHHSVFARTIKRRLRQSGLSARRSLLGLPLTQNHRRLRRKWCDERRMWAAEWNEVVSTDESRICLQHHNGRIQVWIHRGEKMLNSCVMHRHIVPAPCVTVLGGIGYHSRNPLVRITAVTSDQLWQLVEAAFSAVPQEHIQSLFESMLRRVAVVISSNGGYSGY
ncbi:transposable element Tcb1 transposase [Trichonephila clavipes]|nr:transposable element Tcb1 transposase [Trichonephila clavipes]